MKTIADYLTQRFLPLFLIVAVLSLSGCFRAQKTPIDKMSLTEPNKIPPDRILAIRTPGGVVKLNDFEISPEGLLSGSYSTMREKTREELLELVDEGRTHISSGGDTIGNLILIEPTRIQEIGPKTITVHLSDVKRVYCIDKNVSASAWSTGFTVLGTVVGLSAIAGLIFLAIKSSCPLVYSQDENGVAHFEGEVFGGSIFPQLERTDYLPLPHLKADSAGNLNMTVANKLREIQYVNQLKLWAAEKPASGRVFWQKDGTPLHVQASQKPRMAADAAGTDHLQKVTRRDSLYFFFPATAEEEPLETLELQFEKTLQQPTHLTMKLKNSLWLDQLWYQYTNYFGTYYNEWYREEKQSKPADEMRQWQYEQGIPLRLWAKVGEDWILQDTVQCPGPLAWREVAVELRNPSATEFKLEGGLMFWEIDAVELVKARTLPRIEVPFETATDQYGKDALPKLAAADEDYLVQLETGHEVKLRTTLPAEAEYSFALQATGHYEHVRNFDNPPDYVKLISFRWPQSFANYSLETYLKMQNHLQYASL